MFTTNELSRFFLVVAAALCLSACHNPLNDLTGHYEGKLLTRPDANHGTSRPVRIDIFANTQQGTIFVTDITNKPIINVRLTDLNADHFKVFIDSVIDKPTELKSMDGCYTFHSDPQSIEFCFENGEISLEVKTKEIGTVFSLTGDRFHKITEIIDEPAADFTLTKAIEVAFKMNFDNRAEWENVRQARLARNLSRLNLLPGVSLPSAVALIVRDPASILGGIGDLAPFLLPTRWFQAVETTDRYSAEKDTLILLRADTAIQVEIFAYNYLRDLAIERAYEATLERANEILSNLEDREETGQLAPDTSLDVKSIIVTIQQSLIGLRLAVAEDRSALSLTLGFKNPEAVKSLTLDQDLRPVEVGMKNLDLEEIESAAIQRSFEIQQLKHLIHAARFNKLERFFMSLDPAGDTQGKIGAGIGEYIKIGASQVDQLIAKQDALQATIENRVYNAVREYNLNIELYNAAALGLDIQNSRLETMTEKVSLGTSDPFPLVGIFQDYLNAEIQKETASAAFRIARAKIDRYLLDGFYSRLAKDLEPK